MKPSKPLILASTSPYRAASLAQLGLPFTTASPEVDETSVAGESADLLAERLAVAKSQAIAKIHPQALVLGADQVGHCAGRLLHKPNNEDAAVAQLLSLRNQSAQFYTAVALSCGDSLHTELVITELLFRDFTPAQAARYVATDKSWDCAGSFKVEALGIALFKYLRCDDPSAIIGLPLIATVELLARFGYSPLD